MKFILLIIFSLSSLPVLAEYLAYDGRSFLNLERDDTNLYYTYYDSDTYGEFDHALSLACSHPNFGNKKIVFPLNKNYDFQIRAASNLVGFGQECSQWNRCRVFSDFYVASGASNTIAVVGSVKNDSDSNVLSYGYYESTSKRNLARPQDNLNDHTMALFKVQKPLLEEGLTRLNTEDTIDIPVSLRSWDIPENSTESHERPLFTEKSGVCTLSTAKHFGDK